VSKQYDAELWAEATAFAQKHVTVVTVDGDRYPDRDAIFAFGFEMATGPLAITEVHNAVRKAVLPILQKRKKTGQGE
jgi:hypothetical protein